MSTRPASPLEETRGPAGGAGIAPFFAVTDVPATLAFYRDRLGFEIVFRDGYGLFFGNHR